MTVEVAVTSEGHNDRTTAPMSGAAD